MNREHRRSVLGLVSVGLLSFISVGEAATGTGTVCAEIVSGVTIVSATSLDFGQCVAGSVRGQVVVAPTGGRSGVGGVVLGNLRSGSAGSFQIWGAINTTYSITLPRSVVISNGALTMTVDHFESDPMSTGSFGDLGYGVLSVGATLNVGPHQARGLYLGTYDVVVVYN